MTAEALLITQIIFSWSSDDDHDASMDFYYDVALLGGPLDSSPSPV